MGVIDEAFLYSWTGIDFIHFQIISAGEGRCDEQVAGEEDSEGNHHPLQAHKHNRVDLKFVPVADPMQILSCLHFILRILYQFR